ncbi:MAG TPA: DMT family transporter [Anaerolineales bacterium]|nr:DMT family transporter [Anaerolineales bacterium]
MKTKDWIAFILLGLVWGSSFLWIKIGLEELGPFTLVAYRLGFGLLGLAVVVLAQRPPAPKGLKLWAGLVLIGITNTALPFILITWGELFIDSGVAAILNSTVPLFSMLIAHFFLQDERMSPSRLAGLGLGFFGVLLLVGRGISADGLTGSALGQLAVLAAAVCYAGSGVFTRRNLRQVSPIFQAFLTVLTAELVIGMMVPVAESPVKVPSTPLTWIAVAWLGLLGSCVAYLLYFYLIQSAGATRAAMVTYTFPVVGITLGVIFLGEEFSLQLLLGAALVIAGVWIVNSNRKIRMPFRRTAPNPGD